MFHLSFRDEATQNYLLPYTGFTDILIGNFFCNSLFVETGTFPCVNTDHYFVSVLETAGHGLQAFRRTMMQLSLPHLRTTCF